MVGEKNSARAPGGVVRFRTDHRRSAHHDCSAAGHVTSIIGNYSEVEPQIAAGEFRVLATTNATRIAPLSDVPTVRELGLDFEVTAWFA